MTRLENIKFSIFNFLVANLFSIASHIKRNTTLTLRFIKYLIHGVQLGHLHINFLSKLLNQTKILFQNKKKPL